MVSKAKALSNSNYNVCVMLILKSGKSSCLASENLISTLNYKDK